VDYDWKKNNFTNQEIVDYDPITDSDPFGIQGLINDRDLIIEKMNLHPDAETDLDSKFQENSCEEEEFAREDSFKVFLNKIEGHQVQEKLDRIPTTKIQEEYLNDYEFF
jgi:hypothetical protein